MVKEHALLYQNKLSFTDLVYLVSKANRLGRNGHEVCHVFQEEDEEGFHVYFEVNRRKEMDD